MESVNLLPIGPLMREHRLIERMVRLMEEEIRKISETNEVNPDFIDVVIDFLRTYADKCHHGKEEDILFKSLAGKNLSNEHNKTMHELIEEHIYGRRMVSDLLSAKENYVTGNVDSLKDIQKSLKELTELYPMHIEKEDKRFFYPCMEYFTEQEQEAMLQEFWDFDKKIIHEKYQQVIEAVEESQYKNLAKWRCKVCGYIYDPEKGDPERGVQPGTSFEELPEDWHCPVCNAPKTEFERIEKQD